MPESNKEKKQEILDEIIEATIDELRRAEKKHPAWPDDLFHGHAIISEEVGELAQAIIDQKYAGKTRSRIWEEALQVTAMGIRFLLNMNNAVSMNQSGDECCRCGWKGDEKARRENNDSISYTLICPACGHDEFYPEKSLAELYGGGNNHAGIK